MVMETAQKLPIIRLSSSDRIATAQSIHQANLDCGFLYLINHGVENELFQQVFEESRNFFPLPLKEKIKFPRKEHRGYTALYAEKLDPSSNSKGCTIFVTSQYIVIQESFYIGPIKDDKSHLNQWPSAEVFPSWRFIMELYHEKVWAFVVNAGDMMERWTNCLFWVIRTGQECYSMAFFMKPNPDTVVECLRSCCSEASPPRFPPIRSTDYLREKFRFTFIS